MIVDPLIGERHIYYLDLFNDHGRILTGVFSHKSLTPKIPVWVHESGEQAFSMCFRLNRIARLAKAGALKPA